jgi:hypothetical protein
MSYHDAPGLGRRLVRLPGQLLLALVNATALLVIAACVLSLVLLNRVDSAGERIASNVTEAALARLQVSPADFKARIEAIDGKISALKAELADPDLKDHWEVAQQLKDLNRNLADIRLAAAGLSAAGPEITDTAFKQAGDMLTRALYTLRGCETVVEDRGPSS